MWHQTSKILMRQYVSVPFLTIIELRIAMCNSFSVQVSATFHGCQYTVHMFTVEQTTLYVDVEQESNASQWKGSFSSECMFRVDH